MEDIYYFLKWFENDSKLLCNSCNKLKPVYAVSTTPNRVAMKLTLCLCKSCLGIRKPYKFAILNKGTLFVAASLGPKGKRKASKVVRC